ncbi:hypothetical protein RB653_009334 [Dictyostelium firmibasis]|uniref:Uncharacterized protein n=1 Tax=Dictyostelium firmibasis TaxID=79012 RepID=A0AAN7YQ24_9MYCE
MWVIWLLSFAKDGLSLFKTARNIGVTERTFSEKVWFLLDICFRKLKLIEKDWRSSEQKHMKMVYFLTWIVNQERTKIKNISSELQTREASSRLSNNTLHTSPIQTPPPLPPPPPTQTPPPPTQTPTQTFLVNPHSLGIDINKLPEDPNFLDDLESASHQNRKRQKSDSSSSDSSSNESIITSKNSKLIYSDEMVDGCFYKAITRKYVKLIFFTTHQLKPFEWKCLEIELPIEIPDRFLYLREYIEKYNVNSNGSFTIFKINKIIKEEEY